LEVLAYKKAIEGLKKAAEELARYAPMKVNGRCQMYFDGAIHLLKEKEPAEARTMGESKSHGSWWFACGACGHAIDPEDNFCRECGRKIKWDD
jgi:hypothetical protein